MTSQPTRISLLGGFSVESAGEPVPDAAWRLRKAKTLVKLVALAPGGLLHRDRAMETLWPELDVSAAANNLHQALYAARRALGDPAALELRDGAIVLASDLEVDLRAFEDAAAVARDTGAVADYRRALELYRGDLLPEDLYEDWAADRRAALRELHAALLHELAPREDAPGAIAALQEAVASDPVDERAHRELMRLYAAGARPQKALAQYELLRDTLDRELAAAPDSETRALYRELLAASGPEAAPQRPRMPPQLTSFVGRGRELAEVAGLLSRDRLVTLTGPGGAGKTRLAIEAAERRADALRDGAWFVDLAGLGDPALVPQAVALALGIEPPAHRDALDAVVAHLEDRDALILVDNCEHLIDACALLVDDLLRRCAAITVLATSREPLRCPGEVAWRVPALSLPDPGQALAPEAILQYESVRLFADRASAAAAGFELNAQNAHAVAEICYRLDGMPLAIELAAARTAALPVERLCERLGDVLGVLGPGSRTARTRQQTLRATIEWSHDLLDPDERALLRRLAVFSGGFALEAAEEVCAAGAVAREQVLDVLARLVDKSLVIADDAPRYRLLETIRQYAAERLEEAGEGRATRERHRAWCLALVERHAPEQRPLDRAAGLAGVERELDNLRAALASGLREDAGAALRLAAETWWLWLDSGLFREGTRWLRAALEAAPAPTETRMRALVAASVIELRFGADPAIFGVRGRDAAAVARKLADPATLAWALQQQGIIETHVGRLDEAEAALAESIDTARAAGDRRLEASALHASASGPFHRGQLEVARERVKGALGLLGEVPGDGELFFEGLTLALPVMPTGPDGRLRVLHEYTLMIFHRFTRAEALALALGNLAFVARGAADLGAARAALADGMERARALPTRSVEAHLLVNLARLESTEGDHEAAMAAAQRSLELHTSLRDRRAINMAWVAVGVAHAFAGDLEQGRRQLAAAQHRFAERDDVPGLAAASNARGLLEEMAGDLGAARAAYEQARHLWVRQHFTFGAAWLGVAVADVALAQGDEDSARAIAAQAAEEFTALRDSRGLATLDAERLLSWR